MGLFHTGEHLIAQPFFSILKTVYRLISSEKKLYIFGSIFSYPQNILPISWFECRSNSMCEAPS